MQTLATGTGSSVVLLYHRIGLPKASSLVAGQYVAPWLFRSELDYLNGRGWKSFPLRELIHTESGRSEADRFAVTFDDGYLSVFEHACPALAERDMTATIYVVADAIGGINEWDRRSGDLREPMMSAGQVRQLAETGFEIGSHTLSHPHLIDIPDDQLRRELVDSKHKLEDVTGRAVLSISYPYGDYDRRVLDIASEAGYEYGVTTRLGVTGGAGLLEIPRVNVRWNAFGPLLMRKINRARRASRAAA